METFAFASALRRYHVYQDLLIKPSIGEKLVAKREFNNTMVWGALHCHALCGVFNLYAFCQIEFCQRG